jgi:hypothetical protein
VGTLLKLAHKYGFRVLQQEACSFLDREPLSCLPGQPGYVLGRLQLAARYQLHSLRERCIDFARAQLQLTPWPLWPPAADAAGLELLDKLTLLQVGRRAGRCEPRPLRAPPPASPASGSRAPCEPRPCEPRPLRFGAAPDAASPAPACPPPQLMALAAAVPSMHVEGAWQQWHCGSCGMSTLAVGPSCPAQPFKPAAKALGRARACLGCSSEHFQRLVAPGEEAALSRLQLRLEAQLCALSLGTTSCEEGEGEGEEGSGGGEGQGGPRQGAAAPNASGGGGGGGEQGGGEEEEEGEELGSGHARGGGRQGAQGCGSQEAGCGTQQGPAERRARAPQRHEEGSGEGAAHAAAETPDGRCCDSS